MWKKKDFAALALAAVGTFSLTVGLFLPRVVNATGAEETAKVLSPVLHINGCDIRAQAEGTEIKPGPVNAQFKQTQAMPGQLRVAAGPAPKLTFIVKNTTDADATVAFSASMDYSQPFGRTLSRPETKWSDSYNLVLKAGETKEIEVDTKVNLSAGLNTLTLKDASDAKTAIAALYFSATGPAQPAAAAPRPSPAAAAGGIDPAKPVKFVTQTPSSASAAPAGKSPVQQAVQAALRAANQPSAPSAPRPSPAPQTLARNDSSLP